MDAVNRRIFRGDRTLLIFAIVALVGLVLWAIGLAIDPERALHAYLSAWAFAVFLVVGALIFLCIGYAANATWVTSVRRLNEAIVATLPVLAVGFVPIIAGLDELYMWADPPAHLNERELHHLHHKAPYLNPVFFIVRGLIFFAVWIGIASILRLWSGRRERAVLERSPVREDTPNGRERAFCSAVLPLIAITLTFAAFDWLMSLDPFWFSTIFGVYVFAGGMLAGLSVLTFLAWAARRSGALEELGADHFHALGRLLLTFTVFWAYCGFFQAMLIKIANIPEEVTFYLKRIDGSWEGVTYLLIFGHFIVPFALLLLRRIKRIPVWMGLMSVWLLIMCAVDDFWLILPELPDAVDGPSWVDLAALAAVVGVTVLFGAWRQRGRSLLAEGDPFLQQGLAYKSRS